MLQNRNTFPAAQPRGRRGGCVGSFLPTFNPGLKFCAESAHTWVTTPSKNHRRPQAPSVAGIQALRDSEGPLGSTRHAVSKYRPRACQPAETHRVAGRAMRGRSLGVIYPQPTDLDMKTTTTHYLTLFQQYSHTACTSLRIRNHSPETKAQTAIKTRWCQSAIPSMSSPRLSFDNPNRPALHPFLKRGPTLMAQWRSLARPGLQGARGDEKNLTEHGPPPHHEPNKQDTNSRPPAMSQAAGHPSPPECWDATATGHLRLGCRGSKKGRGGRERIGRPFPPALSDRCIIHQPLPL